MTQIPNHFMRYGLHAEKKYFLHDFRDCYGGVAFSGNYVAYSPNGVASFIAEIAAEKTYFIDPITHAFGHHPRYISKQIDTGDLTPKPAMVYLSQIYGEPVSIHIGHRAVSPNDFNGLAEEFTEKVLNFQHHVIDQALKDSNDAKYLDAVPTSPCLLIAPYFYLSANSVDTWLDLNIEFVKLAVNSGRNLPIFAEIVLANEAFQDQELREKVLSRYIDCPANGILLWIESFSEHSASKGALREYRSFVKRLSESGKSVVIMYGGYYSILLTKFGVSAVCHGPGYGEEREITPVGGGIPHPKFYFPDMHMRLLYREVAFGLNTGNINSAELFYQDVCNCAMCKKVIRDDFSNFAKYGETNAGVRRDGIMFEYMTSMTKEITTAHYIYRKKAEFDYITQHEDMSSILHDLDEAHHKCQPLFGKEEASHLQAWRNALGD